MIKESANTFNEGLNYDLNPITTPNNVLTDCVNGTFITFNGDELALQTDSGNTTIDYEVQAPIRNAKYGALYNQWALIDIDEPIFTPIKYGLLYNWYAATDARLIHAEGWQLFTFSIFTALKNYLTTNGFGYGGSGDDVGKSVASKLYWLPSATPGTVGNDIASNNSSGLNLVPGGIRDIGGTFLGIDGNHYGWLSTEYSSANGYYCVLSSNESWFNSFGSTKVEGKSVHLYRNASTEELLLADGTACEPYTGNDGKIYRTVKIGTQVWTADNLAETKFRNGDTIPFNECDDLHSFSNIEWANLETAGCCPYDNDWSNVPMEQPTGEACLPELALELTFDNITNVPVADAASVSDWNTFFDLPTNGSSFTSVEVVGDMVRLIGGSGITIKESLFAGVIGETENYHLISVVDFGCIDILEDNSFCNQYIIQEVILPNVHTIGYGALKDLTIAATISLPLLEQAGDYAMAFCHNIESINMPLLVSAGYGCFADYHVCTSVNLSNLLTAGEECFQNMYMISSIDLPQLTTIGNSGFVDLNNISTLTLPSLTSIGDTTGNNNVFLNATGQTITLTIPAALMTCNGGNPDGDIQYLIDNNTVTIVTV